MSWYAGRSLTWYQQFAVNVIRCGPIPEHVAFIMDGNRRYAKKNNMETKSGHSHGSEKLKELMLWCKEIGVREITAYAFSIENFKRDLKEVETLMDVTKNGFSGMFEEFVDFMKDGICIRVIGNLNLLPKDVRKLAAQLTFATKRNKKFILNLALSYTSRDEITNAIKTVADGVRSGSLVTTDIDEELLSNCMYTNCSEDPDILIRTSGENRFSDFMLWQIQNTNVYFEKVLWPEFGFWNLLKIIFLYQRTYKETQANKLHFQAHQPSTRKETFLKDLNDNRMLILEQYINDKL